MLCAQNLRPKYCLVRFCYPMKKTRSQTLGQADVLRLVIMSCVCFLELVSGIMFFDKTIVSNLAFVVFATSWTKHRSKVLSQAYVLRDLRTPPACQMVAERPVVASK